MASQRTPRIPLNRPSDRDMRLAPLTQLDCANERENAASFVCRVPSPEPVGVTAASYEAPLKGKVS